MRYRSWVFGVSIMLLFVQVDGSSQTRSTLRTMATSKAEISRLDWIFLNARVGVLEALGPQNPIPSYSYDQTTDRVIALAVVTSSWLKSTPSQRIKDIAEVYCASVFIQKTSAETRNWSRQEMFRHFSAQFFAVGQEAPVAVFENGELILK